MPPIERDARVAATLENLRNRVSAQPGVGGVTFANALTGGELPERRIELGYDSAEAASRNPEAPAPIRYATVVETDTSYLGVVDGPILAGRGFNAADAEPGAQVAIVDQAFVDNVLQGRNPIGQQVRFTRPTNPAGPSEWYTVVGLVGKLDVGVPYRKGPFAGFYLPATPDRLRRRPPHDDSRARRRSDDAGAAGAANRGGGRPVAAPRPDAAPQ